MIARALMATLFMKVETWIKKWFLMAETTCMLVKQCSITGARFDAARANGHVESDSKQVLDE
jgi:hypothetical protein